MAGSWNILKYYPRISLEVLMKTTKSKNRNAHFPKINASSFSESRLNCIVCITSFCRAHQNLDLGYFSLKL